MSKYGCGNSEGEQDDLFWDGDTFRSQGITIEIEMVF